MKLNKIIKIQILYCIIFAAVFYSVFIPLACFCADDNYNLDVTQAPEVQTITITKEDIINAQPKSPYNVEFDDKDLKAVKIMEQRHFPRVYSEFSDKERLKNLEYELLGRTWEYTPQDERIRRLKIASSNTALRGVALPASISSKRNAKRMRNDSIQLRQRDDDVGLIDGFLRLVNPDAYELYRQHSDRLYFKYEE